MWSWFRNTVWAQASAAVLGAIFVGGAVVNAFELTDRADQIESYWWRFLDWLLTTPSWITVGGFAILSILLCARHHPAIVVAANKFKRSDPRIRICANMRRAASRFSRMPDTPPADMYSQEGRDYLAEIGNWAVTTLDLERLGFRVPKVDIERDYQEAVRTIIDFVHRVEPLLSAGYVKQAKGKAAELAT